MLWIQATYLVKVAVFSIVIMEVKQNVGLVYNVNHSNLRELINLSSSLC